VATTSSRALRRAPVLALLAVLLAAAPAFAAPATVQLEELTWTELRERVDSGATIALVPIGGAEQNGPHIALGKHNARVRVLAERIAQRLGNALVAPVLAYVPEGGIEPARRHMRWPGTISVPPEAFAAVLAASARSLQRAGLRDVVFLCDHGGYLKDVERVAARLPRVHALPEYYRAANEGFARLLRERGHAPAEIGSHAGLADTALTLATAPALVRADALAAYRAAPGDGVSGDPRRASAELGRLGADAVVEASVTAIRSRVRAQ